MTATVTATVTVTAIDKKPGPLLTELSRSIARSIFRVRVWFHPHSNLNRVATLRTSVPFLR